MNTEAQREIATLRALLAPFQTFAAEVANPVFKPVMNGAVLTVQHFRDTLKAIEIEPGITGMYD